MSNKISGLSLVCVFYLLFTPVAATAQDYTVLQRSFAAEGQPCTLKVSVRGNPENLVSQNSMAQNAVIITTEKLSGSSPFFKLIFNYDGIGAGTDPFRTEFSLVHGSQFFTQLEKLNSTLPSSGQLVYTLSSINLAGLGKAEEAEIRIRVLDIDSKPVAGPFSLPVRFLPSEAVTALVACQKKADKGEKLACLRAIKGNQAAEAQLAQLVQDSLNLDQQIRSLEGKSRNKINEYNLSCKACSLSQFELVPTKGIELLPSVNLGYRIVSGNNQGLIIRAREWSTIRRVLPLPAFKKAASGTGQLQKEEAEPEQDTVPDDELDPVDSLAHSPDDSSTVDQHSVEVTAVAYDSLWQYSIAPLITEGGLMTYVHPGPELSTRLRLYLAEGTGGAKKGLAYVLLYRLWVVVPVLLLWVLLWLARKRRKQSVEVLKEAQSTLPPEPPADEMDLPVPLSPVKESLSPAREAEGLDIEIAEVDEPNGSLVDKPALAVISSHSDYLPIHLKECWQNTATENVFFRKDSIKAIGRMLQRYNAYSGDRKDIEQLPEIGGFILGHVYDRDHNSYDVSIEQFVPITPESHDRYTVKFGNQAWMELDDAIRTYPGLKLVGWFHTHPGHGLFLSEADLREHRELFRERYQLALEIDPTTPKKDTAFFTWTKGKDLNNRSDRQREWWSFIELEQQAS